MDTTEIQHLREMADLNYPFTDVIVPTEMRKLFADIRVSVDQSIFTPGLADASLKLVGFSKTDDDIQFLIFTSDSEVAFNTMGITPEVQSWGTTATFAGYWSVYRWRDSTTNASLTVVVDLDRLLDPANPDYVPNSYSFTGPLTLGASSVDIRNRQLRSIQVKQTFLVDELGMRKDGVNPTTDFTFDGDIRFINGYNTVLAINPVEQFVTTAAGTNRIQLNVDPGRGQGKFPDCTNSTSPMLRTLNGQTPDDRGNMNIASTDCYRVECQLALEEPPPETNPRLGTLTPGALTVVCDCSKCSECSQFAQLYKLLRGIYDKLVNVKQRAVITGEQYGYMQRLVQIFKDYVSLSEAQFRLIRNQDNIYTVRVGLKAGNAAFSSFHAQFTYPAGYTVQYLKHSGWEKSALKRAAQADAVFSPSLGADWTIERTIPKDSVSWWYWTIKLTPEVGTPSSSSGTPVQITGTFTADKLVDGGTETRIWGPFKRKSEIEYPASPLEPVGGGEPAAPSIVAADDVDPLSWFLGG